MTPELLEFALRVDRAVTDALSRPLEDGDRAEVLERLTRLSSHMSAIAFYRGPHLTLPDGAGQPCESGTNWQALIHRNIRSVKTAKNKRALREAFRTVRRELQPLTGVARQAEMCFAE